MKRDKYGKFKRDNTLSIIFFASATILFACSILHGFLTEVFAANVVTDHGVRQEEVEIIEVPQDATVDIMRKIYHYAEMYDVDPKVMTNVIECESRFQEDVQSAHRFKDGSQENSWGISQIFIDVHDVTKEQATDPDFAIEFMAKKFAKGEHGLWTCYKLLY